MNPDTPYKTVDDLLDAMKAKPGQISVATAGVNSSGHSAIEAIARQAGVKYKHVTYDGGNPAVVATVAGETEATTQLTVEQAEMIRGKRLRPLAVVGDRPVELDGYGTIEPLTKSLPQFKDPANYFGIFIPKSVPPEVIATVEKIWADNIMNSEVLKKYATEKGAQFVPSYGAERGEGRDARGAGQRVAGVRRRQGEGLAGHARHSEALAGRVRTSRMIDRRATREVVGAHRPASARPPGSRFGLRDRRGHRLVRWTASSSSAPTLWHGAGTAAGRASALDARHALGAASLAWRAFSRGARRAPIRERRRGGRAAARRRRRARCATAVGDVLALVYTLGLVGRVSFPVATALFVFAFIMVFDVSRPARSSRSRRRAAIAAVIGRRDGRHRLAGVRAASSSSGCPNAMFDGLIAFGHSLASFLTPLSLFYVPLSSLVGLVIGALPGLTATMGVTLMTTMTIKMPSNQALLILICTYVGAIYGGSRSAILLNIPGTPASAAACLDGHALARQGLAGRAMGIATSGSVLGTLIGMLFLAAVHAGARRARAQVRRLRVLLARAVRRDHLGHADRQRSAEGMDRGHRGAVRRHDRPGRRSTPTSGSRSATAISRAASRLVPALVGAFGLAELLVTMKARQAPVKINPFDSVIPKLVDIARLLADDHALRA